MRDVAVIARPGDLDELGRRHGLAPGLGPGPEHEVHVHVPAEPLGRAHLDRVDDDPASVPCPEDLGHGVSEPHGVKELPADRVEVDGLQHLLQALGRGLVRAALAVRLHGPGPGGHGVQPLVQGGLAPLVPQDVAVLQQDPGVLVVVVGVAGPFLGVGRQLADVRAGDLPGRRIFRDSFFRHDDPSRELQPNCGRRRPCLTPPGDRTVAEW